MNPALFKCSGHSYDSVRLLLFCGSALSTNEVINVSDVSQMSEKIVIDYEKLTLTWITHRKLSQTLSSSMFFEYNLFFSLFSNYSHI